MRSSVYLKKLIETVDGGEYSSLLSKLFKTEFVPIVDLDKNRMEDAMSVRYNIGADESNGPVNILEMLVTLAYIMERDLMYESEKGDRTVSWFWLMLQNAGLTHWDNNRASLYPAAFESEVSLWMNRFVNRDYGRKGELGGIFPIKEIRKDIRKVDLWTQMNWYVRENFSEEF